jgi:hypothetical protein
MANYNDTSLIQYIYLKLLVNYFMNYKFIIMKFKDYMGIFINISIRHMPKAIYIIK